jgi:hypothetical protein
MLNNLKKNPRKFSEGSLLLKMTWKKVQFQFLLQKLNKMACVYPGQAD